MMGEGRGKQTQQGVGLALRTPQFSSVTNKHKLVRLLH